MNNIILKTLTFLLISNSNLFSQSKFEDESIYAEAFQLIKKSNCLESNLGLQIDKQNFFVSSQVLKLFNTDEIDTTSSTFLSNEKFYPKSSTFYIDEQLFKLNDVDSEIFYDTSAYKVIVFFSEIKKNFLVAEIYLYNNFPVIWLNNDKNLRQDILYHRSYEYLKEFDIASRFLFTIVNKKIVSFWCH